MTFPGDGLTSGVDIDPDELPESSESVSVPESAIVLVADGDGDALLADGDGEALEAEGEGEALEAVGDGLAVGAAPTATNEATVDAAEVTEIVHVVLRLEQAPLHPPKSVPDFGIAVRVTVSELANPYAQAPPQLIPPGLEVTIPGATPAVVIDTATGTVTAESIGQGASTVPSRPIAAVFDRVLPATLPNSPAINAAPSEAVIPRISDVPDEFIQVATEPSIRLA